MRNDYGSQAATYEKLAPHSLEVLNTVSKNQTSYDEFIHGEWQFNQDEIAKTFSAGVPANFLDIPQIGGTMFANNWESGWFATQYNFLNEVFDEKTRDYLIKGELIGGQKQSRVVNGIYTNHNNVHHVYHLARYEKLTGKSLSGMNTIVEWGGGFGNLARILRLYAGPKTYVLIDAPATLTIQWVFLSCVFGEDAVNILTPDNCEIKEGCFNLISFRDIDVLKGLSFDMFIATWSLNESTHAAQDHVAKDLAFFSAAHLLIGLYRGPAGAYASPLGSPNVIIDGAMAAGAQKEEITYFPDYAEGIHKHFYIVR